MAEKLIGSWREAKTENLEEFMKDAKTALIIRKLAKNLTFNVEIIKESDEEWRINYLSTFKDHKTAFKLKDRFRKTTADNREVWVTYSIEGDKIVFVEEPAKENTVGMRGTIELLKDGQLLETVTTVPNGVVLQRWYTQQQK